MRCGQMWRPAGAAGLVGFGVVVAAVVAVGAATGARQAETVLAMFSTHGTYSWTVPSGVRKVTFDVFGASGGNVADGNIVVSVGGQGGEARGQFALKPGQTLEVVVGGRGGDNGGSTGGGGGFNGGGSGGNTSGGCCGGGGGGGASDVRIGGFANPCATGKSCGYGDRFIVGGGGGGGGGLGHAGGIGGGVDGGPGIGGGGGGSQELGGDGDPFCDPPDGGAFGVGGSGNGPHCLQDGSGGGGGGWYGGGATSGYGGGGSGFVSHVAHGPAFPGGTRGGDGEVVVSTP
jgi:hypothetical protein